MTLERLPRAVSSEKLHLVPFENRWHKPCYWSPHFFFGLKKSNASQELSATNFANDPRSQAKHDKNERDEFHGCTAPLAVGGVIVSRLIGKVGQPSEIQRRTRRFLSERRPLLKPRFRLSMRSR